MTRNRAIALLVAVFLLGGISGASATFAYSRHELAERSFPPALRPPAVRMRALERALDLTSDQADRIHAILDKHKNDRRVAWDEVIERCGDPMRQQKAALDQEIRAVLTPPQIERFDALSRKQEERFFHHFKGGPKP